MEARHSQIEFALIIEVYKSTVSRELHRASGLRGYRSQQTRQLALQRRHAKCQPRLTPEQRNLIEHLISEDSNPAQISR